MPALDELLAVLVARCRTVAQRLGAIRIHEYLAGDQAHVFCGSRLENGIRRVRMHGAEYQRRRRAVFEELIDEDRGDLTCIRLVRESHLPGKRISVQPVE